MGHGFPILDQERPNTFEMPAVSHKAAFQIQPGDRSKKVPEIGVKRGLAPSEHDLFDAHRLARVPGHLSEEFNRKKVCGIMVKSIFVTKTVAAM
jgi:hypothetical protein